MAQGHVAIGFNPLISEPAHVIAARIRDAINDPETQAVLSVSADTSDSFLAGMRDFASTSHQVNLFGPISTELIDPVLRVSEVTTDANRLRDALLGVNPSP
ncbi:hypothetical protein RZS08_67125, partial [Arthrospira platensis SPKY1]|nr:hypothetical protein [Arthrospira platensis SPKY1]